MKNKAIGLLALVSCVMLAGCNNDKKEATIEIKDIPTDLCAGDSIDLSQYIVVSGGNGGYSINFDDDSIGKISLKSETEITLNEFGTVNFSVDYSGKSAEGTINVGSKMLKNLATKSKDVVYDYAVLTYNADFSLNDIETYGENFFVGYNGGALKAKDGKNYSFMVADTDDLVFQINGNEYDEDVVAKLDHKFDLPTTGYEVRLETYKGEQYEIARLDDDESGLIQKLFLEFTGSYDLLLSHYGYKACAIELQEETLEFNDGTAIDTFDVFFYATSLVDGEEVLWDVVSVAFDEEMLELQQPVKDFLAKDVVPTSSFELNVDKIAEAVSSHNYQIDYSYNWYSCKPNSDGSELIRGSALNKNPFVEADDEVNLIHDIFFACGGFSAYVTPDQTFVDVPHGPGYGLVEHGESPDDTAFKYSYDEEEAAYVSELDKDDTGFPIYHEANNGTWFNYDFLNGAEIGTYGGVYDDLFINDMTANKSNTEIVYSLNGETAAYLFDALFYEAIYDGSFPEDWICGSYNSIMSVAAEILDERQPLISYFDVEITEKLSEGNVTELKFEFVWTDYEQISASSYNYYQYVISATVKFTAPTVTLPVVQFNSAE